MKMEQLYIWHKCLLRKGKEEQKVSHFYADVHIHILRHCSENLLWSHERRIIFQFKWKSSEDVFRFYELTKGGEMSKKLSLESPTGDEFSKSIDFGLFRFSGWFI